MLGFSAKFFIVIPPNLFKIPNSLAIEGINMQKLLQNMIIGDNLQRLRKERSLSQQDIIIKLQLMGRSMSRATYAHIEQGVLDIYVSDLVLLRKILNVEYNDFFKDLS